ncbi:hypothetical protein [Aquimarina agarivorans]|uniref:hypothetical protein n=1 Tax=Aquimarina agarivorans TaxID=980584 RepID=UPI0011108A0E|nr:hypothetical protein [Aquimarina agarivorans]
MSKNKFNNRFIIVSENLTGKLVLETIATLIKVKPPTKGISKNWVRIYAYFELLLSKIFGRKPTIPLELVNSLYSESVYDNSKVIKALNWDFEPMDIVFKKTAKYFVD